MIKQSLSYMVKKIQMSALIFKIFYFLPICQVMWAGDQALSTMMEQTSIIVDAKRLLTPLFAHVHPIFNFVTFSFVTMKCWTTLLGHDTWIKLKVSTFEIWLLLSLPGAHKTLKI